LNPFPHGTHQQLFLAHHSPYSFCWILSANHCCKIFNISWWHTTYCFLFSLAYCVIERWPFDHILWLCHWGVAGRDGKTCIIQTFLNHVYTFLGIYFSFLTPSGFAFSSLFFWQIICYSLFWWWISSSFQLKLYPSTGACYECLWEHGCLLLWECCD
jgi:hypothetical protein